jgi:Sulfotransferase domain
MTSTIKESERQFSPFTNFLTLFHPKMFWLRREYLRAQLSYIYKGDHSRAREVYDEHYAGLEEYTRMCPERTLTWCVEDGWEPLCDFLGKRVPEKPFPAGNVLEAFSKRVMGGLETVGKQAFVRMLVTVSATSIVFGAVLWARLSN